MKQIILLFVFGTLASAWQDFDTLAFVQRWPLCKNASDCPIKDNGDARFLVSGLVPFLRKSGKIISDCDPYNFDFDLDQLSPIEENLEHSWPNWPIDPMDNETTVWEKEWKTHGSCIVPSIESLSNELDYFSAAIDWATDYDFMAKLKESFIYPGRPVFVDLLWHALRSVTKDKGVPSINCKSADGYGSPVLAEIAICFDAKTMKSIGCGKLFGGDRGNCPKFGNLWLPNPVPNNSGGGKPDPKPDPNPYWPPKNGSDNPWWPPKMVLKDDNIPDNPYWPPKNDTPNPWIPPMLTILKDNIPDNPYWPPKNGSTPDNPYWPPKNDSPWGPYVPPMQPAQVLLVKEPTPAPIPRDEFYVKFSIALLIMSGLILALSVMTTFYLMKLVKARHQRLY